MTNLTDWAFRLLIMGFGCLILGAIVHEMIDSGITFEYIIKFIREDWNWGIGIMLIGFFISLSGGILIIMDLHRDDQKE